MNRRRWIIVGILLVGSVFAGSALYRNADLDGHTNDRRLHVNPVDAGQERNGTMVNFGDLTTAQQRVFEEALHGESNSAAIPDGVDAQVWIENDAVQHRNRTYEIAVAVS